MKNSSTAHNRMKINSKQDIMTNMKFFPLICIGLALALAAATTAAEPVEPWPTKVQLRSIEQAAYAPATTQRKPAGWCVSSPTL